MPQGPLTAAVAQNPSGNRVLSNADANSNLLTGAGDKSALNVTAAAVIKVGKGRLCKIIVVVPGTTSGAFTINDAATTGAAAQANVIWSQAYNAAGAVAGQVINVDVPVTNGIVVSAVPGAGSPQLTLVYN